MNATTNAISQTTAVRHSQKTKGRSLRWLIWIACLPMAIVLAAIALISVREYRASSQLKQLLSECKESGVPYDDASMDAWYRKNTHEDGARAWADISDIVSSTSQVANIDSLPIVGTGTSPRSLNPNVEWKDEPVVAEYLKEMRPVLAQMHEASKFPTPVQFPIQFEGFGTLLPDIQSARSVSRLAKLDFEHACYHRQADRALRDLKTLVYVAKMIDSGSFMVSDLVVTAIQNMSRDSLRRSLEVELWNESQLSELRELVGMARFSKEKWQSVIASERAMVVEYLLNRDTQEIGRQAENTPNWIGLVPLLPSGKLKLFNSYGAAMKLGEGDLTPLVRTCSSLEKNLMNPRNLLDFDGYAVWMGLFYPAYSSYAQALENDENDRRLTLASLALRQFKQRENRWPKKLSELESLSLSPSDYSTVNGGMLGYEVEDTVAYLWGISWRSRRPEDSSKVSPSRPVRTDDDDWEHVPLATLR
ncbi:MAG: hypothetical protein ABL921_04995 [Pirellula sp.]